MWAKTATMTTSPAPLTPKLRNAGGRALVGALAADQVEHVALPVAHLVGRRRRGSRGRPCSSSRVAAAEQRRAGGQGAPGGDGALGGAVGLGAQQLLDAALERDLEVLAPASGRPVTAAVSRSRSRPTCACRLRIHSPVPTNSCHRASTSPRSRVPLRTPSSTPSRARSYAASAASRSASAAASCASTAATSASTRLVEAVERAGQRLPDDGGALLLVGGQAVQPVAQRRDLVLGQPAVDERALLDDEQPRARRAGPRCEHAGEVVGDLGDGLRRHPVEHDGQRGAALLRRCAAGPTGRRRRSGRRS